MRFLVDLSPQRKREIDAVKMLYRDSGQRVPSTPAIIDECIDIALPSLMRPFGVTVLIPKATSKKK